MLITKVYTTVGCTPPIMYSFLLLGRLVILSMKPNQTLRPATFDVIKILSWNCFLFEVHQYNQNHSLKPHKENMFTKTLKILFSFLFEVKQYN